MEDLITLLTELTAAPGVSGCENGIRALASQRLSSLGSCETTPLGSLICRMKTAPAGKPHLLLTAHMDQIGLIVTYIDQQGFLRVGGVGGLDRAVLPAAQVEVHTRNGIVPGVICTVPPHLSSDDKTLPKVEDLAVDIGFSREEAEKRVMPGDRVLCVSQPLQLLNGRLCAQALDNRAGCAAILRAAQDLAAADLDCSLSILLSTMEEVGEQGAGTGARLLCPTHAIIVDVSFAHTPDARRSQCGEMSRGVMLGAAPVLDNEMFMKLRETALQKQIPFQFEAMGGATGTDADAVAVAGAGVRCALLSIPLRYMHTPAEVIDPADVDTAANLISAYTRKEFGGAS